MRLPVPALWLIPSACAPVPTAQSPGLRTVGADEPDSAPTESTLPPTAVLLAPPSIRVGATATLDGSRSTDPQGLAIVDFAWSCSDGSTASGPVVDLTFQGAGTVSCALTVRSESGLTDTAVAATTVRGGQASWTVMVFMNADNNLEGAGLGDLNEMERIGSTGDVNVVVQIDRSVGYTSADGNWTTSRRYLVGQDQDRRAIGSTLLEDLGEVDSGDPQTVIDFGTWAIDQYPAEHYALVLWDHGWGWSLAPDGRPAAVKGISSDDQSGNDISIADGEFAGVLAAVSDAAGRRLDLVGMDACLMASWEIAHVAADHADVFVASQDYEGVDGWAYDGFLGDLVADPAIDALTLGDSIARHFYESGDSTQSAIDLSALGALDDALDDVALALLADPELDRRYAAAAAAALAFEWDNQSDHDLGDFLALLQTEPETRGAGDALTHAISTAQDRLDAAVAANYTFGEASRNATGLTIYTPTRGVDPSWLGASWAADSAWTDLVRAANAP